MSLRTTQLPQASVAAELLAHEDMGGGILRTVRISLANLLTNLASVLGPAGAVNEHLPIFDGTTGKLLKSAARYPLFNRSAQFSSTPVTLTAAEGGTFFINFNANRTVNLPTVANTIVFGFYTQDGGSGGNLTINRAGSALLILPDGSTVTSLTLTSFQRAIFISEGNNWIVLPFSIATETFAGMVEQATDAEIRSAATGARAIMAQDLETASALVGLSDAATIAVDWNAFINASVTITANRQLGNPTNGKPGQWRTIYVVGNDGTDRSLTFAGNYLGEVPVLTDIDNTRAYLLMIYCLTTSHFTVSAKRALG